MTKWEDELKVLLSGSWRPCLDDGFSVYHRSGRATVRLYPPQGVYSYWRGRLEIDDKGVMFRSGSDALSVMGALMGPVKGEK